jgi:TctA family transporter
MLETMYSALTELLTLQHLAYMLLGIAVGLGVGILPGLGGIAGMSLLIPFIYGMDPTSALAMLVGMVAVIPTGDTFTSVLMGIPGSSASQATVLDGYPMAKQGQAARALSAAFSASMLGGLFGAVMLTGFVFVAKPLILTFSSAELFMFAVLGLSVVGVLAGRSIVRGLAACGLGVMVGAIGAAPATGESRFDLGLAYLQDGVPLVIVGLGLFAIPEIAELIRRQRPITSEAALGSGWLRGVKDTLSNKFLVLRSSALGTFIGAIPGLGGGVVDWLAYGQAVHTVKDKSQFGKGDVRGVIAPESANNALQGGALMPTLMFGIPGSGSMAVFLGGMLLLGIQPGPTLVTTELSVTYTIAWTLAIASIIGAAICFVLAGPISRLTFVSFNLIAPFMIMIICFAAFQARRDLMDLVLLAAIGLLGIFLRRFGWPRPAFLIGFVLSAQIENYFFQALQFHGWGFLQRPGVLIIGALALVCLFLATRTRVSDEGVVQRVETGTGHIPGMASGQTLAQRRPQLLFALAMLGLFAYGALSSVPLTFLGKVFPLSVSVLMLVCTSFLVWHLIAGAPGHATHSDQELADRADGKHDGRSIWPAAAWFLLLFVLTALLGFIVAITLFMLAFLRQQARVRPWIAVLYTALSIAFMGMLGHFLALDFPGGLLQSHVELPWPLR